MEVKQKKIYITGVNGGLIKESEITRISVLSNVFYFVLHTT